MGQHMFKDVLDSLCVGVYMVDRDKKITYWNQAAAEISGFSSDEVRGQRCSDGILVHIDRAGMDLCQFACPLERALFEGKQSKDEVYLRHKDGHRIPVSVCIAPLIDADGQVVGCSQAFTRNTPGYETLARLEQLEEEALRDSLTGLANRRHTEQRIEIKLGELLERGWSFGVLFVDIDGFKAVNDTYGHDIGDRVLKMLAATLRDNTRADDLVGRWGGEELVVLLADVTRRSMTNIAEKLRYLVEQSAVFVDNSRQIQVTISIGAALAERSDTVTTLMERADRLMYRSKGLGKNRVSVG